MNNIKVHLYFLVIYLFLFLLSCGTTVQTPSSQSIPIDTKPKVYIAGFENISETNENYFIINYKEKSIQIKNDNDYRYSAEDTQIINGDVYTVGTFTNIKEYQIRACYWVNNEIHYLGDEDEISHATGILFLNGDIYICGSKQTKKGILPEGSYKYSDRIKNTIYSIIVWKNGEEYTIAEYDFEFETDDEYYGFRTPNANMIVRYDNNFIIIGNINKKAVYWYNSNEYLISENAIITSAFINGNDMYFAGYDDSGQENLNKTLVAKYWKNTEEVTVSDGKYNSVINSIYVENEDVYLVGASQLGNNYFYPEKEYDKEYKLREYIPFYWKNGVSFQPEDLNSHGVAIKVLMIDDKLTIFKYLNGEFLLTIGETATILYFQQTPTLTIYPTIKFLDNGEYYFIEHISDYGSINRIVCWEDNESHYLTDNIVSPKISSFFSYNEQTYLLFSEYINLSNVFEHGYFGYYHTPIYNYYINTEKQNIDDIQFVNNKLIVTSSNKNVYLTGLVDGQIKTWFDKLIVETQYKINSILFSGNNLILIGTKDNNLYIIKNGKETMIYSSFEVLNYTSEIYLDRNIIIYIIRFYDPNKRQNETLIFANDTQINNVYDFRSSGLFAQSIKYRNNKIFSYGTTEQGNYYYSIGNKSYNMIEKRGEIEIFDFEVLNDIVYMVGTYNGQPTLWKNRERTILSNFNGSARKIFITR